MSRSSPKQSRSKNIGLSETFTFERSKLVATKKKFRKEAVLRDIYNKTTSISIFQDALVSNVVVSHSGRTLAEILSLSYPEELSKYTVEGVAPARMKGGTLVAYSRPESDTAELLQRINVLEERVVSLETQLQEVQGQMDNSIRVLDEWQTANLVLHAFASFVWSGVSDSDKSELAKQDIHSFLKLFHSRSPSSPTHTRTVAKTVYAKLNVNIQYFAGVVMGLKSSVSAERTKLAHPEISQESLEKYLDKLSAGFPELEPCDIALFSYLKSTSITPENVQRATRGG